jgi:hypothetical protein
VISAASRSNPLVIKNPMAASTSLAANSKGACPYSSKNNLVLAALSVLDSIGGRLVLMYYPKNFLAEAIIESPLGIFLGNMLPAIPPIVLTIPPIAAGLLIICPSSLAMPSLLRPLILL